MKEDEDETFASCLAESGVRVVATVNCLGGATTLDMLCAWLLSSDFRAVKLDAQDG